MFSLFMRLYSVHKYILGNEYSKAHLKHRITEADSSDEKQDRSGKDASG